MAKTIWMAHLDQDQASLWHTALSSQQMKVISKPRECDLKEELEAVYGNALLAPDLVLLDVGIKSPNSEMLQSGTVCQWAGQKAQAPKIVLVNPRQDRIKDLERTWALRRGASDMLPRLSAENLTHLVGAVTELIGRRCVTELLHSALRQKMAIANVVPEPTPVTASFLEDQSITEITTAIKNPDPDEAKEKAKYVIYRGVRVRR